MLLRNISIVIEATVRRLMAAAEGVLPADMAEDARNNLKSALSGALDRMDLVTREEFEIQEGVLQKTRMRLQELEAKVAEMESKS